MAPTRPSTSSPRPRRAGTARPRPSAPATRRKVSVGRRKAEPQSNAKKVLGAVATAVPGLLSKVGGPAQKKATRGRKGGAGLAVLGAGAAGLAALKNRDKLPGKLGGQSDAQVAAAPTPAYAESPSVPPAYGSEGPSAT